MGGGITRMKQQELLVSIRDRYQQVSKKDQGGILTEFIPVTGNYRRHGICPLQHASREIGRIAPLTGWLIYDEASWR